jgi:hypothetical protein
MAGLAQQPFDIGKSVMTIIAPGFCDGLASPLPMILSTASQAVL